MLHYNSFSSNESAIMVQYVWYNGEDIFIVQHNISEKLVNGPLLSFV